MKSLPIAFAVLALFVHGSSLQSAPIISELMANNDTGLQDEDSDFSDWIEIHNPDPVAVNLDGWFLTDDAGSLSKWRIPSVSIDPGGFLIVFASNKDRAISGMELHTNFKLGSGGEYLALVMPDGVTPSSEYDPFPVQTADRSYGVPFDGEPLVSDGAAADILVPTNGTLGTTWTGTGFTPTGWTAGNIGVGFGLEVPGMTVRDMKSTIPVTNLAIVDSLIAGNNIANETTVIAPVVNFLDTGGDGNYGNNALFPNNTPNDDNDFAIHVTGTITIPTAGLWTFGINGDDGGRVRIDGADVIVDDTRHGAQDRFGSVTLTAGTHALDMVFFENGGGAESELFAAFGNYTAFNAGAFRLIGDTAAGGLAVTTAPDGSGSTGVINTDIGAAMQGNNASVYVRVPFSVADVGALDSLSLSMRYNDGFALYLNGTKVADRNAPGSPAWNSNATASRTTTQSLTSESINLTSSIGLLNTGSNNVLAVHGLNISAADGTFLALPELSGGGLGAGSPAYFDDATPGTVNSAPSSLGAVADTKFTPDRGFYPNTAYPTTPFQVTIESATPGASIRYTTNGSAPSETSGTLYTGPITVSSTTTLRAIAYLNGYDSTNVDTHTYILVDDVITQSEATPPGWPSGSVNNQIYNYGMDPNIVNHTNPALGGVQQVKDALMAIPSVSIVMNQNDFSGSSGMYSNPGGRGFQWERPASAELIFPEGYVNPDGNATGFQVDAGIRVRGGFSRSTNNPKHALRLFFRAEYGDAKLQYPLFGDEGATEFDNLDFRTAQNYSWAFQGNGNNTFMREVFPRDTQRDMGQPHTRSRYYHIYINGIYWGLYMSQERAEASYAETYFGGSKDEYDTVKSSGSPGGYTMEVTDGTLTDWTDLWNQAITHSGSPTAANYMRMQGLNPDGTPNATYPVLLDVDNLIDYMTIVFYTYSTDAPLTGGADRTNNWFGTRNRVSDDLGFQFYAHDMEHSQGSNGNVNSDRTGPFNHANATNFSYSNPQYIHQLLLNNPEYQTRFGDRAHQHFFNSGPLTADAALARYTERADTIGSAIIAESARWGDSKREPAFTSADWTNASNYLLNTWAPQRSAVTLNQLRDDNLYPDTDAPAYAPQHGGYISSATALNMVASDPTIYYTLDGSDPRLLGGGVNGGASQFQGGNTSNTTLVASGSSWKYLDDGSNQGTAWRGVGFNDAAWAAGNAELGYGDGGEATVVGSGPDGNNKYPTTYFRRTFSASGVASISSLQLDVRRDDGAIVYINGVEAWRTNMPGGTVNFDDYAAGVVGNDDEINFFTQSISPSLLVEGANTIAVEIHQASGTSSDISFDLRLIAQVITNPNPLMLAGPGEVTVSSRVLEAGNWSALNAATFYVDLVPASSANLVISEIHYRPASPSVAELNAGFNDRSDFEFIEIANISSDNVHLRDVIFDNGIGFDFSASLTGTTLAPSARLILVNNLAAFQFRYPGVPASAIGGTFTGNLNNDGERIVLLDASGTAIQDFTYNDAAPWPTQADGDGQSLVLVDPDSAPDHSDPMSWRPSTVLGGTPGGTGVVKDYASWKIANSITDDNGDPDGDGLSNFLEYAFGSDPFSESSSYRSTISYELYDLGAGALEYLTLHVRRCATNTDLTYTAELSTDLEFAAPTTEAMIYAGITNNGDGTETLHFRSNDPRGGDVRQFVRALISN